MLKTEAIQVLLRRSGNAHLTNMYTSEMEVQVNVSQGNGERVKGEYKGRRWFGWKDPSTGETWKSFRIPWNAKKNPEYVDRSITFDLASHTEGIGMTGWNWVRKSSLWVGFDFDSIINHKEGLSEEKLNSIKSVVANIPYVTLVKSTSGKGFHIYIHFSQPVPIENHTEHSALARSILTILSVEVGFNLTADVDTCGGILWCYHVKQEGTDGLELIRQGKPFDVKRIPANWKDHISVTSGSRRVIKGNKEHDGNFQTLLSSTKQEALDDEHKRLLQWFNKFANDKYDWWWDTDNNMLVCHTHELKKAHSDLSLKGIFETNSSGSSRQNCYAFPSLSGSWVIRRHSMGVNEHPSWLSDPSGWTRCVFNAPAEFIVCARSNKGVENSKGEYVFNSATLGLAALSNLDINLNLPEEYLARTMVISEKKDGKLLVQVSRQPKDNQLEDFLINKKGDYWEKIIHRKKQKREIYAPDHLIRHTISQGTEAGWWIHTRGEWVQQNKGNVVTVLLSQESAQSRNETELIMGKAILNPWKLTNFPFVEEYPGNRYWNKDSASLSVKAKQGDYDTWLQVLDHCGASLTSAVLDNEWCARHAIETGSEYLATWIASMFQNPNEPLPYLFFVGPQNSGKSTLHEALALLFKKGRGYARADNALINQQGFNSEIGNSVLCVVEETDLRVNKEAGNRIKDWVTGKTISLNTKYKTVYDVTNTTHWIQCSNDISACPILPGDTRITLCWVDLPSKDVPKKLLFEKLEEEKAAFLDYVLTVDLPKPEGRLAVPCLKTLEKAEIETMNKNDLQLFMDETLHIRMGYTIEFYEFYQRFKDWLPADKKNKWSAIRVSRYYPKEKPFCKGKTGQDNRTALGNVSFDKSVKKLYSECYTNINGRLEWRFNDKHSD